MEVKIIVIVKNNKILFQIFDFSLHNEVLKILKLLGVFCCNDGVLEANIWAGKTKKEKFKNFDDMIAKLENQKFNSLELNYKNNSKDNKSSMIKSMSALFMLSPLNEMWLPLRQLKCKSRTDESTRLTLCGGELGSKWKKEVGINDRPSRLEFWIELKKNYLDDDIEKMIVENLMKAIPEGVNNETTGYVGIGYEMNLSIKMDTPFEAFQDFNKKLYRPYPVMFGAENLFSKEIDIIEADKHLIKLTNGSTFIIMLLKKDLQYIYNRYKNLFINLDDKKYKPTTNVEGEITINGRRAAITKKRLRELIAKDYLTEEMIEKIHHIVFPEYDWEGLVFEDEKLYIYQSQLSLDNFKKNNIDIAPSPDDSNKKEIVEYHMKFYRSYENPESHKFIEDYLNEYFGVE